MHDTPHGMDQGSVMDSFGLHTRSFDIVQDRFGGAEIDWIESGMCLDEEVVSVTGRADVSCLHPFEVGENFASIPLGIQEVLNNTVVRRRPRSVVWHRLH